MVVGGLLAVTVYIGVPLVGGLVAVLLALAVWVVVSLGLYLGLRALLVHRGRPRTEADRALPAQTT